MRRIRVRNISWKDYGISVQTQRELKEFCFLYDEKKKRGNSQDLTDCKMIEEAARESSEELAGEYSYIHGECQVQTPQPNSNQSP